MRLQIGVFSLVIAPCLVAQPASKGPTIHIGPNLRVSALDGPAGERNEGWITASLTDPDVLVGTSHITLSGGCLIYTSTDRGAQWKETQLSRSERCFDMMTAAGPNGRLYTLHAGIEGTVASAQVSNAPLGVWRSTDSGKTWLGPSLLRTPLGADHPRIAVDNTNGPHRGRIYIAWNEGSDTFFKSKYYIFLHRSDDGGVSFGEPKIMEVDSGGKLVTTEPLVLSDGTLLVTYYQFFMPLTSRRNEHQPVYLLRSANGGDTFGRPEKIGDIGMPVRQEWYDGYRTLTSAFTLPIFAVDGAPGSKYRDRIYMVWHDANSGEANIWLRWSSDQGRTWSEPKRINDDPARGKNAPLDLRATPTVAVNKDGVVGIAWYDRRDDPSKICWRQYFSASLDGGESWTPNVPISSVASCPGGNAKAATRGVTNGEPRVIVVNAQPDSAIPSEAYTDSLHATGRSMEAYEIEGELLRRGANASHPRPSLRISFNDLRDLWPGHYTGLTADAGGTFHAMWADRRDGPQRMYTATIDLDSSLASMPAGKDTVVTDKIELIAGPATFDTLQSTVTFDLQLRNTSQSTISGPLRLHLKNVTAVNGTPTISILNPDSRQGGDAFWDFTALTGTWKALTPGMVTEARKVTLRVSPGTGLDGQFVFEATGSLHR